MNWKRIANDVSRTLLPMLAAWVLLLVGPDIASAIGRGEVSTWLTNAAMALFVVGLAHPVRRILFPYVELWGLFKVPVNQSPDQVAMSIKALAICIVISSLVLGFTLNARAATLPGQAERLLPTLRAEQRAHWPDHFRPALLAGQVEQESIWKPLAHLHTSREDGYGLAQFTVVSGRFNAIAEIVAAHPRELAGFSVANAFDTTLQLRAVVLKMRDLWRCGLGAESPEEQFAFAAAGYNGGCGSVAKRRAKCRGVPGCNADLWYGHAELHPPQARTAAQGYGQSFADINSQYPGRVRSRSVKYEALLPPMPRRALTLGATG